MNPSRTRQEPVTGQMRLASLVLRWRRYTTLAAIAAKASNIHGSPTGDCQLSLYSPALPSLPPQPSSSSVVPELLLVLLPLPCVLGVELLNGWYIVDLYDWCGVVLVRLDMSAC